MIDLTHADETTEQTDEPVVDPAVPTDEDADAETLTMEDMVKELIKDRDALETQLAQAKVDLERVREQRNTLLVAVNSDPKMNLEHRLRTERNQARAQLAQANAEIDKFRDQLADAYDRLDWMEEARQTPTAPSEQPEAPETPEAFQEPAL